VRVGLFQDCRARRNVLAYAVQHEEVVYGINEQVGSAPSLALLIEGSTSVLTNHLFFLLHWPDSWYKNVRASGINELAAGAS
jgi:hypothetical protein